MGRYLPPFNAQSVMERLNPPTTANPANLQLFGPTSSQERDSNGDIVTNPFHLSNSNTGGSSSPEELPNTPADTLYSATAASTPATYNTIDTPLLGFVPVYGEEGQEVDITPLSATTSSFTPYWGTVQAGASNTTSTAAVECGPSVSTPAIRDEVLPSLLAPGEGNEYGSVDALFQAEQNEYGLDWDEMNKQFGLDDFSGRMGGEESSLNEPTIEERSALGSFSMPASNGSQVPSGASIQGEQQAIADVSGVSAVGEIGSQIPEEDCSVNKLFGSNEANPQSSAKSSDTPSNVGYERKNHYAPARNVHGQPYLTQNLNFTHFHQVANTTHPQRQYEQPPTQSLVRVHLGQEVIMGDAENRYCILLNHRSGRVELTPISQYANVINQDVYSRIHPTLYPRGVSRNNQAYRTTENQTPVDENDLEQIPDPVRVRTNSNNTTLYDPNNPDDTSNFVNGEEDWTVETPPAILGMLDPPPDYEKKLHMPVSNARDAKGREIKHAGSGLPLRKIPCLPDRISSDISELHIEVYMRTDPRVHYNDIRARQPAWLPKQNHKEVNALNNRRTRRVRDALNVHCWSGKYAERPTKGLVKILDKLTPEQIECNTTWTVTPHGIHPPNNPGWLFPKSEFKKAGHQMSDETKRGMKTLQEVRAKAVEKGVDHWTLLKKEDLPSTWSMRQVGNAAKGGKRTKQEMSSDGDDEDEYDEDEDADGDFDEEYEEYDQERSVKRSRKDDSPQQTPTLTRKSNSKDKDRRARRTRAQHA